MLLKKIVMSNNNPDASFALRASMSFKSPVLGYLRYDDCSGVFYIMTEGTDSQNRPMGTDNYYRLYNSTSFGFDEEIYIAISENDSKIGSIETIDSTNLSSGRSVSTVLLSNSVNSIATEAFGYRDINEMLASYLSSEDQPTVVNASYTSSERDSLKDVNRNFNRASNIGDYNTIKLNNLSAFNRFRIPNNEQKLVKAFPRIFFTRPDLNFFDSTGNAGGYNRQFILPNKLIDTVDNDVWYNHTYHTDPHLIASLTRAYSSKHIFNPFLSNMASSFDISDEKLESDEHGATFTGWKIKFGRHNIATKSAGSFSVSYDETNRLEVYKIHKAWVDYISKVYKGEFISKEKYIKERRLDYACSVYYFICAEDGETVLFWSKYVGVFPTNIPSSQFSWSKNEIIRHTEPTVEYDYAWKEDCDYASLLDFNYNPLLNTSDMDKESNHLPIYDAELGHVGFTYADRPLIYISRNDAGEDIIKLKYVGQPGW